MESEDRKSSRYCSPGAAWPLQTLDRKGSELASRLSLKMKTRGFRDGTCSSKHRIGFSPALIQMAKLLGHPWLASFWQLLALRVRLATPEPQLGFGRSERPFHDQGCWPCGSLQVEHVAGSHSRSVQCLRLGLLLLLTHLGSTPMRQQTFPWKHQ